MCSFQCILMKKISFIPCCDILLVILHITLYFETLILIHDICYFRAAILAISAYLEAFQKIADAATNARGEFLF